MTCIDTNLPWYADYSVFLTLLTLAAAVLVGIILVRSLVRVRERTSLHYLAALTGIAFLSLAVFVAIVLLATECI